MKFAIYDNGTFVGEKDFLEKPVLEGKPWRKFYTVETVKPSGAVVEGPTIEEDHKLQIRRYVYTARNKTVEELATEKDAHIDGIDAAVLKLLMNHENRIRTLEGKQAVSAAQFRTAVKDAL